MLLGDFAGREPGVTDVVSGILSNPMNQAAVSKIAFYSFAEYSWNPTNYDPAESHARALDEVAAGDAATAAALRVFADLNWFDGQIHRESAPQLAAAVDSFWDAWNSGARASAVDALRPRADDDAEAPEIIRAGVEDELFVAEADAWLRATELWGRAMQQSLLLLSALDSDDGAAAWTARQQITALVAEALAIRDTTVVHNQTHPRIAEGVLDTFVAEVVRLHDRWLGAKRGVTAQTNLPVYQTYTPALMADGDLGTWFWSSRAVRTGDYVQLDLGSVAGIGDISLQMARDASPGDYFHQGTLEYSVDGSTWTPLISAEAAVVETTAPAGTEARYVRYRATADNVPANWASVREFQVEVRSDGVPRVTSVRSVPAPAEGSDANRAADGDPATAFVAGRAPVAGDLLEIDYSQSADLSGITVLQRADQAGTGVLEARSEGVWVEVGTVSGEYARTSLDLPAVDALRILWAPGATAPAVAEVIPVWASEGVPLLTAPELDLVRGEPTVVEVVLSAPVGSASSGSVTLSAPADWVVAPESVAVSVPSGLNQSVAFTLTPPASAPLGDVERAATLTDADGNVVVEVPVVAHVRPVVGEVNVALGRPVLASGVEPGTAHQPAFAVDGRLDTRWAS
ncbi:MAG TPA: discoidin domain-containing protein, partial [Propionicimonas sp.]|nr:discoidin domain-containing protein [Propionicimonas sp.]